MSCKLWSPRSPVTPPLAKSKADLPLPPWGRPHLFLPVQTLPCLRLLWAGRHTQISSDPNSCSFSSPWLVLALFPKLLGRGELPSIGAGSSSLSALILAVTLSRLLALNTRLLHLPLCISQVQTSLPMPTLVYPTTHSAATPAVYRASPAPLHGRPP